MSTMAYGFLTTRRKQVKSGNSDSDDGQGVTRYVDAVAALVPAEVLTIHAIVLAGTTTVGIDVEGNSVTTITDPQTLKIAFFCLLAFSALLYLGSRWKKWGKGDFIRTFIAPAAFVAWTMLQRTTAFDALPFDFTDITEGRRTLYALLLASALLGISTIMAKPDDTGGGQDPPPGGGGSGEGNTELKA